MIKKLSFVLIGVVAAIGFSIHAEDDYSIIMRLRARLDGLKQQIEVAKSKQIFGSGSIQRRAEPEGIITGTTIGSLVFVGSDLTLTENNASLFWDNTNNRLGIGTTSPYATLSVDVNSTNPAFVVADQGGNGSSTPYFLVTGAGTVGIGTTTPTGTNTFSISTSTATSTISVGTGQSTSFGSCLQLYSATGTAWRLYIRGSASSTANSGGFLQVEPGGCNDPKSLPN